MRETGILSIVKREPTYQVRYAAFNPYDKDRRPYPRPDEGALVTLLHDLGINGWSLQQALRPAARGGRGPAGDPLGGADPGLLSAATSPACRDGRGGHRRSG